MGDEVRQLDGRWVVPVPRGTPPKGQQQTQQKQVGGGSLSSSNNNNNNNNGGGSKRAKLGRKRGASRSGKTAYVEPRSLEGPTDALAAAAAELREEELRLRTELSGAVAASADALRVALADAATMDALLAR